MKRPLLFQFNQLLDSRVKIRQIFAGFFFEKLKTPKSNSEINCPLTSLKMGNKGNQGKINCQYKPKI